MPRPLLTDEEVAARRSVRPAVLAAVAEAGIIFLPIRQILIEEGAAGGGPAVLYPVFVALFAGAVAIGLFQGRRKGYVTVVALVALVLGAVEGGLGSGGAVAAWAGIVLALAVAFRVVTLVFRDWREPAGEAFVVGTVGLLLEVMAVASFDVSLRSLLPPIVALFFVGMLGSRAATVRLVTAESRRDPLEGLGRRFRVGAWAAAVLLALMVAAASLSGRGGVFQDVGRVVYGIVGLILAWAAVLMARVLLPPLLWLFDRLHFSLRPAQRAIQRFADRTRVRSGHGASSLNAGWARLIGFMIMALIAFLLIRAIRRYWREVRTAGSAPAGPEEPLPVRLASSVRPSRLSARRFRRELPANTVRRWYAEALLLLESKGLAKPVSTTPGEFLLAVRTAYPECASGFTALTRAYEDVRYGRRTIDQSRLEVLSVHHGTVIGIIRRTRSSHDPDSA